MKALVLCGGWGTRLRPFTYTVPKHLLPVAGRPLLTFVLQAIRKAGVTDVGVVVSPDTEAQFQASFGDGAALGLDLTYIVQPEPKGLAHAVLCAEALVEGEPFLVVLGDNLLEYGVAGVVEGFRRTGAATVAVARVEDPHRFGVAVVEGERIRRLVEKPATPPSDLAVVGVYAFPPTILEAAREIRPSFRGELELTDAIQRLIDRGEQVLAHRVEGWWQDVGRPEDLLAANRLLLGRLETRIEGGLDEASRLEGVVAVAPGAEVCRSRLRGPVVIGAGAWVEESEIGPNVALGANTVVAASTISESIVMEGARVEGVQGLAHSIIGRGARVCGEIPAPSVFLGDGAQVVLPTRSQA